MGRYPTAISPSMERRRGGVSVNNRLLNLAGIVWIAALTIGCGESHAPMAAKEKKVDISTAAITVPLPSANFEIDFRDVVLPPYVTATGLGAAESWGRWSVADKVTLKFGSSLPKKFALVVSAKAYGANAGLAIPVKADAQTKDMVLGADSSSVVRIEFSLETPTDMIEINVPKPTVPTNGDLRALGIAMSSVKIETIQ